MKTIAEKNEKIKKYTGVSFSDINKSVKRAPARSFVYTDGRMMFNVPERELYKFSVHKYELIGVYDYRVKTADLRSDLAWYAETYLEGA